MGYGVQDWNFKCIFVRSNQFAPLGLDWKIINGKSKMDTHYTNHPPGRIQHHMCHTASEGNERQQRGWEKITHIASTRVA